MEFLIFFRKSSVITDYAFNPASFLVKYEDFDLSNCTVVLVHQNRFDSYQQMSIVIDNQPFVLQICYPRQTMPGSVLIELEFLEVSFCSDVAEDKYMAISLNYRGDLF